MASKRTRVSVILKEQEFQRLEEYCWSMGFKKSTLIARLIRDHLDSESFQVQQPLPLERSGAEGVSQ